MNVFKRPISLIIVCFWFCFWLLNALDKVLARQDIGSFHWWGNHRIEKFSMYFERLSIDIAHVFPTLVFAGLVELAVALPFFFAAIKLAQGKQGAARLADKAIGLSLLVFIGFTVFDIIVGDRAELLEHSTYIGVLLVSFLAVTAETFLDHLHRLGKEKEG
ncbi:hypothetical protein [Roseibium algae]|uniref:Uncharacterized protein n=1 Tax=Roseibium algae TaxID=3123038 RepID=A0ABU8TNX2_9HYPH